MKIKKLIASTMCLLACCTALSVAAQQCPRGVSADHRIQLVEYDPDNVTLIKAHYGYETQILFSDDETVQNVSIGDALAWQAVPVTNHLFLKPIAASTTNMTVLTNLRNYNFQLISSNSDNSLQQVFECRFLYPGDASNPTAGNCCNAIPTPQNCPYYNGEYSYVGDKKIVPLQAFDDGKFTYLKFRGDGEGVMPAVFSVDKNRNESLVNYHIANGYLIVNQVGTQFTLRNGNYVATVFNDKAIGDWNSVC